MSVIQAFEVLLRNFHASKYTMITRPYSVFPSTYIKPTFRIDEIKKMEENSEIGNKKSLQVRPAQTCETSSEFYDPLIRKIENMILKDGKRTLAKKLMDDTLSYIKLKQLDKYYTTSPDDANSIELDPKVVVHAAVQNVKPVAKLLLIRRGGIKYNVPVAIDDERATFTAIKWLITAGTDKHRRQHFVETFATDILLAAQNTGRAVKMKHILHKKCDENRAYAHYRWMAKGSGAPRR